MSIPIANRSVTVAQCDAYAEHVKDTWSPPSADYLVKAIGDNMTLEFSKSDEIDIARRLEVSMQIPEYM